MNISASSSSISHWGHLNSFYLQYLLVSSPMDLAHGEAFTLGIAPSVSRGTSSEYIYQERSDLFFHSDPEFPEWML